MAPLIGLASLLSGLWFVAAMPVLIAVFATKYFRGKGTAAPLVITVVMTVVFYAAASTIWNLAAPDWPLSLPRTFEASIDSRQYGHPVEHQAETILVWMLLGSTLAASVAGAITTALQWKQLRAA